MFHLIMDGNHSKYTLQCCGWRDEVTIEPTAQPLKDNSHALPVDNLLPPPLDL